jgi:phosphatidate cytidylyltransferase
MQYFLGVFWVLFIAIVVSANDAFAYIVGRSIGRTPLIRISPNKTLEGFLGGCIISFVFVLLFTEYLFGQEKYMCMN